MAKKLKDQNQASCQGLNQAACFLIFKGTVSVILSDLPVIKWHVRFTTIPFKPLLYQGFRRLKIFLSI